MNDLNSDNNENRIIQLRKNDRPSISFSKQNGVEVAKEIFFYNRGENNYIGKLSIEEQSLGTTSFLDCMPIIFNAQNNESVFFVDEIENSLHPSVIKQLIKYFGNSDSKGQLIFTTHQCVLLDQQEVMRPDEVWFAEKNNGDTKMYSLNDFKEHNTIDIQKGYLAGRYGAIPFAGERNILDTEH